MPTFVCPAWQWSHPPRCLDKSTGLKQEPTMDSYLTTVRRVISEFVADLLACLRFYSRLPIPPFEFEQNPYGSEITARIKMLPFAGALIGGFGALTLLSSTALGLALPLAATLAILCLVAVTGAFHEDGLADFADSTGGATRETRLEILKDSRNRHLRNNGADRQRAAARPKPVDIRASQSRAGQLGAHCNRRCLARARTTAACSSPARTRRRRGLFRKERSTAAARRRAFRFRAELAAHARRRESHGAYSTLWCAALWLSTGSRYWRGGCSTARREMSPAPRSKLRK